MNPFTRLKRARAKKRVRLERPIVLDKPQKQAFTDSEEKYRKLVELAYEGITIVDPDDNLTYLNRRFAKSLGYTVKDLIGKSLFDLAVPESVKKMKEEMEKRKKGKKSRYEVTLVHKDGSHRYFVLSASPIFGEGREFEGSMAVYTDITKRRKAEEALKLSEKRFRMMIDQSHMGFVVTDQGRLVFANKKLASMAGFSSWQKMRGLNLLKYLTPESYKKALRSLKRKLMGKSVPAQDEYSFYRKGKKVYFRTFTKDVVLDGKNMSQTFVLDITDRKLMERKLERRVKQIKALYKVYSHARLARKFSAVVRGITEDVVGAFPRNEHAQARIMFDNKACSYPKKFKPFVSSVKVPLSVDGVERGYLEVGYTEKNVEDSSLSQERELAKNVVKILSKHMYAREVLKRHQEIVNKSFTAIMIVSKGIIRYANPRFYTLFKTKGSDTIDQPLSKFLPDCRATFKNANGRISECKGKRANGSDITIEITMLKITYRGEPSVLIRASDITALKKAQAKLKNFNKELRVQVREKTKHLEEANKRLLSLNQIKDEFMAITSHELRSPLTSIRGYLSFLVEDEAAEKIPEPYHEYLIRAYNTTDSLNYLINNILDVSRLDMGRFELQLQDVDVIKLTKNIVDSLAFQAGEKRLELEFENQTSQLSQQLKIDSIRMSQVLRNILDNSIKFTKRGKKIRVTIRKRSEKLIIQVADQGVGIPKAKLKQIFEKFMQVKNIHTKYKGGVGLGLFIAKRIVELHGGKIRAERNDDKGTTISIELPINGKAE